MMQAGKDYLAKSESKAEPEYESPRVQYLRELLRSVRSHGAHEEPAKIEPEPIKSTNQNKPTLKLTK